MTNASAQVGGTLTRGGMQATGAASLRATGDVPHTLTTGESLALAGRAASMAKQTRPKFAGWQQERMVLVFTSAPIEVFIDTKSDERHQKREELCLDKLSLAAETKIAENAELRPETVRSINLTSNDRASRGTLETEISNHTCESTSVANAHQSHALPTHEQTTDDDQPQHDERLALLNVARRRLMRHMTAHAKLIEMLNDHKVSASHLALLQEETEMITSSLSACLQEGLEGTVCRGPKIEQRQ